MSTKQSKRNRSVRERRTARRLAMLLATLVPAGSILTPNRAEAINYFYDNNNNTAGFGTAGGTWAAPTPGPTPGWTTDGTGSVIPGSVTTLTTDTTNFGNGATGLGAGTITVSGTVNTGNMTFASGSGAIVLSGGTINLAAPTTITVDNAANTINSNLSGAGASVIKAGTGTLNLGGVIGTTTGGITVNAGTLNLTNAGNTFTGNILVDGSTSVLRVEGNNGAAGDPTRLGSGTKTITLQNGGTYVSHTTTTNPTSGAASKNWVIGTGGGTIQTDSQLTLDDAGQFSGTGSLTKTGSGLLNLASQAFTYSGTNININAGTLRVNNAGSLGAGSPLITVASGAVFDLQATLSGTKTYNINGTGIAGGGALIASGGTGVANGIVTLAGNSSIGGNGTLTLSGGITDGAGSFNLTKVGTGQTVLSGTSTYDGTTTVAGGILRFQNQVSLYNNTPASWTDTNLVVNSGATAAFNVGGAGQFTSANIDALKALGTGTGGFLSGSSLGLDTGSANFTYGSIIANTNGGANVLGLTKLGGNTLTLTAAHTYTGTTNVAGGGLELGNGGTTGSLSTASALSFAANTNFQINQSDTVTQGVDFSGAAFTGNVNLIKAGTGNLVLTGNNTVRELRVNNATGFVDIGSGNLFVNNGGGNTISSTTGGTINGTGTITISTGGGTNYGDNSTANGTTLTINPRVTGTAANGFEYCCTAGGTIFLANNTNDFGGQVFINVAGTIRTSSINNIGVASGLGLGDQINLNATGANLDYVGTGSTTNRTLVLGNNVSASITQSGASGHLLFNGTFSSGPGAETLTLQGSTAGTGEISSVIGDGGGTQAIAKSGTGTWTLSGANTYTGITSVNAGVLRVTNGASLGTSAGGVLVASGATLELVGSFSNSEAMQLTGTGVGGSGSLLNNGTHTLGGNTTILNSTTINSNSGLLTLNGDIATHSNVVSPGVTFTGAGDTVVNGTISNASTIGFSAVSGRLFLATGLGLATDAGIANIAFAGAPANIDPLTGDMNFADDNAFTTFFGAGQPGGSNFTAAFVGDLNISGTGGTYSFGFQNHDDSAAIWIDRDDDGIFETAGSAGNELVRSVGCCNNTGVSSIALTAGSYKFAYVVEDTGGGSSLRGRYGLPSLVAPTSAVDPLNSFFVNGSFVPGSAVSLTKNGTGTLTLTNANTYAGGTTVNDGTLLVNNVTGSALGTGNVVVNSGATLGGSGAFTGDLLLNTGAIIAPDGSLDTGSLIFGNNAIYNWEVGDLINVMGDLTFVGDAIINIIDNGAPAIGTHALFTWTDDLIGFDPANFTFNLIGFDPGFSSSVFADFGSNTIFLVNVVPEPASVSLLALAGMTLLGRRSRRSEA